MCVHNQLFMSNVENEELEDWEDAVWRNGSEESTCPKKRDFRAFDSLVMPSSANPLDSASYPCTGLCSSPARTTWVKKRGMHVVSLSNCPSVCVWWHFMVGAVDIRKTQFVRAGFEFGISRPSHSTSWVTWTCTYWNPDDRTGHEVLYWVLFSPVGEKVSPYWAYPVCIAYTILLFVYQVAVSWGYSLGNLVVGLWWWHSSTAGGAMHP